MHKRAIIATLLILFTIAIITAPVLAQVNVGFIDQDRSFRHSITYVIGGRISIDRELGHACTTGAVKRQQITGYGDLTKTEEVRINNNIMNIVEVSDWTTAADAIAGLIVTTTIQLCSRPLSVAEENYKIAPGQEVYSGDYVPIYHPYVVEGYIKARGLTRQLWATSVMTNPGEEGSYHADFIAAYGPGPYERLYGVLSPANNLMFYDEKYMWEFDDNVYFQQRDHRLLGYKRGDFYVGNYFNIEQYAYTSGGDLKRFISMSSPFEGTFIEEDLHVIGMAAVRETFKMHNLERGKKGVTLAWYELF